MGHINNDDMANSIAQDMIQQPGMMGRIKDAFSAIPNLMAESDLASKHMAAFKNTVKSNAGDLILQHCTKVLMEKLPFGFGGMIRSKVSDDVIGMVVAQVMAVGLTFIKPAIKDKQVARYLEQAVDLMVYGSQAHLYRWTGLEALISSFLTADIKSEIDRVIETEAV